MKKIARITSKGRVTIPPDICRAMGVQAGDSLLFERKGAEFRGRSVRTKSPFEKFRGIGTPGIGRGRKAVIRYVRYLRGR